MSKYYDGDIIIRGGYRFRVNYPRDDDAGPPWENSDQRGIVSDWTTHDKRPGERVLSTDRRSRRFFDWAGTIAKAKEEGWGISEERRAAWEAKLGKPPTKGQIAEAAVQSEFDHFRSWCNNDWMYVGLVLTHIPEDENDNEVEMDYGHAVWGFGSSDEYLYTETDNMIDQYVSELDEAKRAEDAARELAAQEEEARDMRNHDAVVALRNAILWSHFTDEFKLDLQLALATLAESAGTDYPPK